MITVAHPTVSSAWRKKQQSATVVEFQENVVLEKREPDSDSEGTFRPQLSKRKSEDSSPIVDVEPEVAPSPRITSPKSKPRHVVILQQFEGVVTEVTPDSIWAELHDLTAGSPVEVVELPLSQITEGDRTLLVPGSVFYWSLFNERKPGGQISNTSEIRMQRSPKWTRKALRDIAEQAVSLFSVD